MYVYLVKPDNFPIFLSPFQQRFWVHCLRRVLWQSRKQSHWKPCVSSVWLNQFPWKEAKNGVPYPNLKSHPSRWRKKAECGEVCGFTYCTSLLPCKPLRKWQIETGNPAGSLRNDCCNPSLEPKTRQEQQMPASNVCGSIAKDQMSFLLPNMLTAGIASDKDLRRGKL